MSGNLASFHEILNQTVAQNFSFLSWQTKKVLFLKKIWSVPCTMDSSFFSQQMPYCLLTLLVYMALLWKTVISHFRPSRYYFTQGDLTQIFPTFSNPKLNLNFYMNGDLGSTWVSNFLQNSIELCMHQSQILPLGPHFAIRLISMTHFRSKKYFL